MQQKEAISETKHDLGVPEKEAQNFWQQWQKRFSYLKNYWKADPENVMPQIEIKDGEGNISRRYYDLYQPGYDPETVQDKEGLFGEFQDLINTRLALQGREITEENIVQSGGQKLLQKMLEAGYDIEKSITYAHTFYNKYRSSWISNVSGEIQLFINEASLTDDTKERLQQDFESLFSKIKQEQKKSISRKELIESIDDFLGVLTDLCASQEIK